MKKILEGYFLAKIDYFAALVEILDIVDMEKDVEITSEMVGKVCEVLRKLKATEINVSKAEERLGEIFER